MSAADEFMELFGDAGVRTDGTAKTLTVRTYLGAGQLGPDYADAEVLTGLPQFSQSRLVRGSDGNEALSTAAAYAPLSMQGMFTLDSLVTLDDGRETTVLTVQAPDVEGVMAFVHVNLE